MSLPLSLISILDDSTTFEEDKVQESGKFRCNPCDKTFEYKRSLQRHIRENKRHLDGAEDSDRRYKCPRCPVTCARAFDLRRHQIEHHKNDLAICDSCGHCRPDRDHGEACGLFTMSRNTIDSVSEQASEHIDLARFPKTIVDAEGECNNGVVESEESVPHSKDNNERSEDLITRPAAKTASTTCGHCRKPFEHDQRRVARHLAEHFRDLLTVHTCQPCCVGFVRKQDFIHHERSAGRGDCGFSFAHASPCTGHHPASSKDQLAFCQRLREWEQSQLTYFRSSVRELLDSYDAAWSCLRTGFGSYASNSGMGVNRSWAPSGLSSGRSVPLRPSEPIYINQYAKVKPPTPSEGNLAQPRRLGDLLLLYVQDTLIFEDILNAGPYTRAVYKAIVHRDHISARALVARGCERSGPDLSTWRLLCHTSVGRDVTEIIRRLPEMRLDVEFPMPTGQLLVLAALKQQQPDAVSTLTSRGIDVNCSDPLGITPLRIAMELDDDDLIKSLLTYGAKIESRSDGQRSYQPSGSFALPLVLAVRRRKCEIARVLIQGGADVNLHNPLCIAVENQDLEMVQVLMSHGADPNQPSLKQAWTPLFYAVQARNCLLIDLLALGGANINPTDLYKQTPLHVALRGSDTGVDVDVVRELVALGANVDVADQWDDTPLALICVHDRSLAILLTEGTGCELTVYPNALRKLEEAGYTSDMTTKDAREILRSSIDTTNHWLVCW